MGSAAPPNSRWDLGGKFQPQGCISFMGPLSPCPRGPLLSRWWPRRPCPGSPSLSPALCSRGGGGPAPPARDTLAQVGATWQRSRVAEKVTQPNAGGEGGGHQPYPRCHWCELLLGWHRVVTPFGCNHPVVTVGCRDRSVAVPGGWCGAVGLVLGIVGLVWVSWDWCGCCEAAMGATSTAQIQVIHTWKRSCERGMGAVSVAWVL